MTMGDYVTAISFIAHGIPKWDDWVEDDSGLTCFIRFQAQREQLRGLG